MWLGETLGGESGSLGVYSGRGWLSGRNFLPVYFQTLVLRSTLSMVWPFGGVVNNFAQVPARRFSGLGLISFQIDGIFRSRNSARKDSLYLISRGQ